jgi:membrane-associated protease RseP (regulator of RpoE activity)
MVTNTLLTPDEVMEESLIVLENEAGFANRVTRDLDQYFDGPVKIGSSIRMKVPPRYTIDNSGPGVTPQNVDTLTSVLVANSQPKIGVQFTDQELALELQSFSDSCLQPAIAQLAAFVDNEGLSVITGYTISNTTGPVPTQYQGTYGGIYNLATPGAVNNTTGPAAWTGADIGATASTPAQAAAIFNNARATLINEASPEEQFVVLDPNSMSATVPQMISLFNDRVEVSDMYKKGLVGVYGGAMFHESPNVNTFTSGTWTNSSSTQVSVTSLEGATSIVLQGVGATATINQGDQFVVANVHQVNPLTRLSTRRQRVFVATNTVTAVAGVVTVPIAPTINSASGANAQNATVDTLPQATALVTFMGTPNTQTSVNLRYNKNAIALAVAKLPSKLAGAEVASASSPETGWSIRWTQQYQATAGVEVSRMELLLGWAVIRPSLAVRLQG